MDSESLEIQPRGPSLHDQTPHATTGRFPRSPRVLPCPAFPGVSTHQRKQMTRITSTSSRTPSTAPRIAGHGSEAAEKVTETVIAGAWSCGARRERRGGRGGNNRSEMTKGKEGGMGGRHAARSVRKSEGRSRNRGA